MIKIVFRESHYVIWTDSLIYHFTATQNYVLLLQILINSWDQIMIKFAGKIFLKNIFLFIFVYFWKCIIIDCIVASALLPFSCLRAQTVSFSLSLSDYQQPVRTELGDINDRGMTKNENDMKSFYRPNLGSTWGLLQWITVLVLMLLN